MKNPPKILVLGSSGLVGQPLVKRLRDKNVVFTTCHKHKLFENDMSLDITSEDSVRRVFENSKPDVVVNLCTVYNNLDYCEKNKKLVMRVNGLALKSISHFSNKFDAFLISISSDFVFDGKKGNYKEDDEVSPINYYGISKIEGEKNIKEIAKNYCIVRTSMIYGKNNLRKTLPERIIDGIKKEEGFHIIKDQYMKLTYLDNFCNMLQEVIERKISGTLHLVGLDRMSRYEFGLKLLEELQMSNKKLIPVKKDEFPFGKIMPKDSSLNADKAFSLLNEKPQSLRDSLIHYLKSM